MISRNEKIVFSDNFPMKKNVASKKSHRKIETVIEGYQKLGSLLPRRLSILASVGKLHILTGGVYDFCPLFLTLKSRKMIKNDQNY